MGHYSIDGIVNLNKPHGMTSFQMVALVRRLSGVRKVGHSGTLDPNATGVLPVLLGRATKLSSFLMELPKTYRAEIEFGIATDTYDSSGKITRTGDISSLGIGQIETSLENFRGHIEQIPPMYSALKYQGKPLCHLARAGIEVVRKPRKVTIFRLDMVEWQNPVLTIEVECSKGTYIRSLAHDLGQILGCGAYLKSLVRIRNGPFHIDEAISVDQFERGVEEGNWEKLVLSPDVALPHLGIVVVDAAGEDFVVHGRPFALDTNPAGIEAEIRRAYSTDGRFLAIVCFCSKDGFWHPRKVFMA